MKFFIKEWPDETASLMSENGSVIAYFPSIDDAIDVCHEWYQLTDIDISNRNFDLDMSVDGSML